MTVKYNSEHAMPQPLTHVDNQGFWDGVKRHQLVLQRCKSCGKVLHPPKPMCPKCRSLEKEWAPASGKGKICSWVTYQQSPNPAFQAPYTVVLVELEEGARIVSNMADVTADQLRIDMPVEVVFDDLAENFTLPKFRKAE